MRKIYLFVIIGFCFSCGKSAIKAFKEGNYYEAVSIAVQKLRDKPTDEEASDVLPKAYKSAHLNLMRDLDQINASNQPFKNEKSVEYFGQLNRLYSLISDCATCRRIVEAKSYFTEEENVRNIAANERYEAAMALTQQNSRIAYKQAYQHLLITQKLKPNYIGLTDKMREVLWKASLFVVIEQPKINSRIFQYSNEFFQSKIEEYIKSNTLGVFYKFYTPEEAKIEKIQPDQIIRLEIIDFIVGQTQINKNQETVWSKDSVKVGDVVINSKKVPVYNRVNANLTHNRKVVRSSGVLLFQVIDYKSKRNLYRDELSGEYTWVNEWLRYNGDKRALTKPQLDLVQNDEQLPPPPQQLYIEFTKPIYDQVLDRLTQYYRETQ